MRVGPVVPYRTERTVQFDPVVKVVVYDEATPIDVSPTLEAIRIARQVRALPLPNAPTRTPYEPAIYIPPVQEPTRRDRKVRTFKDTCHIVSMSAGVAVLPSFSCLVIGLPGLLVPAACLMVCAGAWWMGGHMTQQMEQRAERVKRFLCGAGDR